MLSVILLVTIKDFYMLKNLHKNDRLLEVLFVIFCFAFYFIWSLNNFYDAALPLSSPPDEAMRYKVIKYIFEFKRLPHGLSKEVVEPAFGYSYAFFPTFLPACLSSLFMFIANMFSSDEFILLIAARMTSVISGAAAIWFFLRGLDLLFSKKTKWICAVMLAMLPQYAYMSTYVNNDILCVCGSAVILYGWIRVLKTSWSVRNTLTVGAGIVIIALTYYNGYGWILLSIILFFTSFYMNRNADGWSAVIMKKRLLLIVLFVFAFTGFFFIRNIILYNGDMLGLHSMMEAGKNYAMEELKPENRHTPNNLGISLFEMLFTPTILSTSWLVASFYSFIAAFGALQYFLKMRYYKLYLLIFVICLTAFFIGLIRLVIKRNRLKKDKEAGDIPLIQSSELLLRILLIFAFAIPFCLSVYYSYFMDYQSQGRYLYPGIAAFITILGFGTESIFELLKFIFRKKAAAEVVLTALSVLFVILNIIFTIYVYLDVFIRSYYG